MSENPVRLLPEKDRYNTAVIGATGEVGELTLRLLDERGFPMSNPRVCASERSIGRKIRSYAHHMKSLEDVKHITAADDLDIVFLAAEAGACRELAPKIAETGAIVIDNSPAWRQDPRVPLIVPEVNPQALQDTEIGIIANPNSTTTIAMPVLKPLHDEAGLARLTVFMNQAASGLGKAGKTELHRSTMLETHKTTFSLHGKYRPDIFPETPAFNIIPLRGELQSNSNTDEENRFIQESRRILEIGDLAVSATSLSVPVLYGHSLVIEAWFREDLKPHQAIDILQQAPGVDIVDIPSTRRSETKNSVLVGRIRPSSGSENSLLMVVSGSNLRKGASLNAVQVAELLINQGYSYVREAEFKEV
jgi:aspartate-semialdehyde dehydrogenase